MRTIDNISSQELDRLIDDHEIISFDIFDTLLVRAVSAPGVVFDIVKAEATGAPFAENTGFRRLRSDAEKTDEDDASIPDLEEIYARMGLQEDEAARRMALEKAVESRVLFPNPRIKEIYDKAVERGKTIAITSDMYLSSDFLSDLLQQKGYRGFDKVFVSCEFDKDKQSGGLFDEVMAHYDRPASAILHIGDNLTADISGAKKKGIQTLYVGDSLPRKAQRKMKLRPARPAAFELTHPRESVWFNWGYASLGPLLVAFSQWLHDSEECQGRKLFFLARDARLLFDAYSLLYAGEEPEPRYLYLSRKSVCLACLSDIEDITAVKEEMVFQRYLSWATFMGDLGIDEALWKTMLSDGVGLFDAVKGKDEFFDDEGIRRLYQKVLPLLRERRSEQRDLLRAYLEEEGFDADAVIVDIGWHGTIQKMLERLYGRGMRGCYMGLLEAEGIEADGFLFDAFGQENEHILAAFSGLFETLFFVGHGTTLGYEEDADGGVKPKLGSCEYTDEEMNDLEDLQRGAMGFVSMAAESRLADYHQWTLEEVTTPFRKLALNPSKEDIDLFGSISFLDHGVVKPLVAPTLGPRVLLRPRKFYRDFFRSDWKAGYLRKVFRVPLPYGKFYLILRGATKQQGNAG